MTTTQKAGGIAAILLGALFSGYILLLAVVLPAQGLGPGALNDPQVGIAFIERSWLPALIGGIYLGIAAAFMLIMSALHEHLGNLAPATARAGVLAGLVASGLFLVYAMVILVGNPSAASVYQSDPLAGSAIYLALRFIGNAVNSGALFAAGWSLLLAGWAAWRSRQVPALLSYLMIGAGVATSLSFILLSIGLLGVLLAPIWSIWLGVVLLRGGGAIPARSSAVGSIIRQ
jgi:hypothetical protein